MEINDPIVNDIFNEVINNNKNILIHSPGGTGKSFMLRILIEMFSRKGNLVASTALTGAAAIGLSIKKDTFSFSGTTVHSWAGVGLGIDPVEKLVAKILKYIPTKQKWMMTDILFIDEISMMGDEFFDKLDSIAKTIRRSSEPFGGLKLIISGDFLQLPPIKEKWAFLSKTWPTLLLKNITLDEPKRYPDIQWYSILLRIRKGNHTYEDINFLQTRVEEYKKWKKNKVVDSSTVKPTILYSRRADVDLENDFELKKLKTQEITYEAHDSFTKHSRSSKPDYYYKLLDDAIPPKITLKKGAQVMLKANLDIKNDKVNGSRGVVLDLDEEQVMVRWMDSTITTIGRHTWVQEDKDGKAIRSQIPLILAWATTIHKSQGCSLDYVVCNLGPSVFCAGQAYVALSRVRTSKGLLLEDFDPNSIKVDSLALDFANSIEGTDDVEWIIETKYVLNFIVKK